MDIGVLTRNAAFMLGGLFLTFQLAFLAILGGLAWGTVLALARLSSCRWLTLPSAAYVHFFRGLPLILVIFWLYFLMPVIIGRALNEFTAATVAFVIYEASYFAEIIRSGIQSVPRGQILVSTSSGMTRTQAMRHVVLPQAVRNMMPSLVTHCVVIFQDTSLAYVIGMREFLRRVNLVDAREARSVELYLFAGLVYFILCSAGTLASRHMERRRFAGETS